MRVSRLAAWVLLVGCTSSPAKPGAAPDPATGDEPGASMSKSPDAASGAPDAARSTPDVAGFGPDARPAAESDGSSMDARVSDGGAEASVPIPTSPKPTLAIVGGDNGNVYVFGLDAATCAMTRMSMVFAAQQAWYGAIDSKGQHVYIASLAEGKVLAYTIDRVAGSLTLINSVAAGGAPAHLALDRTDKFLFAAGFDAGKVIVLPVRPDGGLAMGMTLSVGRNPHSTAIDPSNRYLFVQNMGSDTISQFGFDARTGVLTPNAQPTAMLPAKTGPRNGAFHPRLPTYYTANELSNTVTTYAFDPKGTVRPINMQTTVPAGFAGATFTAEVHLSASGRFAYLSNRGADTIAVFTIDQTTGQLTPLAQVAAGGRNPQTQAWDGSGQRFLSANTDGKSVSCFIADDTNGSLTRKTTTMMDSKALWVGVLPM